MTQGLARSLVLTCAVLLLSAQTTPADEARTPGFVPPDYSQSLFEVPVELPDCVTGPTPLIFGENCDDWNEFNSSSYQTFCLQDWDYSSCGSIDLTASGTQGIPRVIRYAGPNDLPTCKRHGSSITISITAPTASN